MAEDLIQQAEEQFEDSGKKQRLFAEFNYAAGIWDHARRVIAKAEHSSHGSNPRYIVSNPPGGSTQNCIVPGRTWRTG